MGATYYTMTYSGATVRVAKITKSTHEIRGSVDGKKYGASGDCRSISQFKDWNLINEGYKEAIATCGSLFYTYDNDCYAEGVEKSMGTNNQDFGMSCVSDFNNVMAVGYPYSGGIVFAKQKDIIANIGSYYGAATFAFGIMKDGARAEWGKTEHSSQYNTISGRAILGQNNTHIFCVDVDGVTGSTGLRGSQLYNLCLKLGMTDAGCWDGGGSVFLRVNGSVKDSTTRKLKNANLIYVKEKGTYGGGTNGGTTNVVSECSIPIKITAGAYGTNKSKVATRPSATGKYSTQYPVQIGDEFIITKMQSEGDYYVGYMSNGRQKGRWILLDPKCMVKASGTVKAKFKVTTGAYGTNNKKIATRPSATAKYDIKFPVCVGDIFTVDDIVSEKNYYIGHMIDGSQAGRWIQLDASDIKQVA